MDVIKVEKRDTRVNAKQLRRAGIVPLLCIRRQSSECALHSDGAKGGRSTDADEARGQQDPVRAEWRNHEFAELWGNVLLEVNLVSIVARIALALLLGGILGAERGENLSI